MTPCQEKDRSIAGCLGRDLELDALDADQILAFDDRYLDAWPENAR